MKKDPLERLKAANKLSQELADTATKKGIKKEALERLEAARQLYQELAAKVTQKAWDLYSTRWENSQHTITTCEYYISTLGNSPQEFNKLLSEFKVQYANFTKVVEQFNTDADRASVNDTSVAEAKVVAATGVVAGAGVAVSVPTVAMAIATTFGTASTGTAISALSGAAATNAALAWLGGGAIAAGGGGIVTGNALLALAGPVGLAIGGIGLTSGALILRGKNTEIAQKANQEVSSIKSQATALLAASKEIDKLLSLTQQHSNDVQRCLNFLLKSPSNYLDFSQEQKQKLAVLIKHVEALSKLLNKKVN